MSRPGRGPRATREEAVPGLDVSQLPSVDLFRLATRIDQDKDELPTGFGSTDEIRKRAEEKALQEHPRPPWQAEEDAASVSAEETDRVCYEELSRTFAVDVDHGHSRNGQRSPNEPLRHPVSVCMADVVAEQVQWLWPKRIPLGKVTVFEGHPDVGKSTVSIDIAARVSKGMPMPDGSRPELTGPAAVILVSAEDAAADTIRPRLDAAGADVSRVHLLTDIEDIDEKGVLRIRPWSMTSDGLDVLKSLVVKKQARLVVIDPMNAFFGPAVDSHRDQDVRTALAPLARLAEETEAALILIRHLTKAGGTNAITRGVGSIGIIGAARSAVLFAKDPSDPSERRRVMARSKGNLAPLWSSLAFELESANEEEHACSRVRWLGVSDQSVARLLQEPVSAEERDELEEIAELLKQVVIDGGGSVPIANARKALSAAGYEMSSRTLRRARNKAGLETSKPAAFGGERSFVYPTCFSVASSQQTPAGRTVATGPSRDCAQEQLQSGQLPGVMATLAGSGDCQACGRQVSGSGNDRLRRGYCPACYRAWRRAGRPDRSEFEAARRGDADA